jgi:hypothetical protein
MVPIINCFLLKLEIIRRMVSSGLLRRVALVRTDVSEEPGFRFRFRLCCMPSTSHPPAVGPRISFYARSTNCGVPLHKCVCEMFEFVLRANVPATKYCSGTCDFFVAKSLQERVPTVLMGLLDVARTLTRLRAHLQLTAVVAPWR